MSPIISCDFLLVSVPPARPSDCSMVNSTSAAHEVNEVAALSDSSLVIECQAGFNGGLPQTFLLEVRLNGHDLVTNQSMGSRPYFKVCCSFGGKDHLEISFQFLNLHFSGGRSCT